MAQVSRAITRYTAKKHYHQTGIAVTASVTNSDNYSREFQYQIWCEGYSGTSGTGTIGANTSKTLSVTLPWTPSAANVTLWTDLETAAVSAATMQYGSQATPDISASFKGGYVDPALAKTITFTSNKINDIYEQYTISSGVFYYKLDSAGAYTSINLSDSKVTIPANTLTTGQTYNAYAEITVDDGTVATVTLNDISTEDAIPTTTPISPVNMVVYGSATFRWSYSVSTGAQQKAVDIQISPDDSAWTDVVSHSVQSETTYDATLSTSGTLYWRVRGYNQDDVAGSWSSSVTFINNIPPDPPVITGITNEGRPTVSWSSSDQIAYQVQVLEGAVVIQDSGAVYSSEMTYQIADFLLDGTYTIRVRVINIYGKASDWASAQYTQSTTLTAPDFTLSGSDAGVTVLIELDNSIDTYYIKRNGVTVGSTTTGSFTDRFVNGTVTYTVIGVASSGEAAQATQTITFSVSHNVLIAQDGTEYLINRRLNSPVGVSKQINAYYDQANFLGASLPEHHFAKLRDGRFTVAFKDYINAEKLLGTVMYYADMYGNGEWVAVTSVGRTESRYGNETTAELQLTTHNEVISYA